MAHSTFIATHGVQFSDDDGVWAHFHYDAEWPERDSTEHRRVFRFDTDDDKVAARLRKVNDYGIEEVKQADMPKADG